MFKFKKNCKIKAGNYFTYNRVFYKIIGVKTSEGSLYYASCYTYGSERKIEAKNSSLDMDSFLKQIKDGTFILYNDTQEALRSDLREQLPEELIKYDEYI